MFSLSFSVLSACSIACVVKRKLLSCVIVGFVCVLLSL